MRKLLRTLALYPAVLSGAASLLLLWLEGAGILTGGPVLRALQLPAYAALLGIQIATGWLFDGIPADASWLMPLKIGLFFVPFVLLDVTLRRAASRPASPGRGAV